MICLIESMIQRTNKESGKIGLFSIAESANGRQRAENCIIGTEGREGCFPYKDIELIWCCKMLQDRWQCIGRRAGSFFPYLMIVIINIITLQGTRGVSISHYHCDHHHHDNFAKCCTLLQDRWEEGSPSLHLPPDSRNARPLPTPPTLTQGCKFGYFGDKALHLKYFVHFCFYAYSL